MSDDVISAALRVHKVSKRYSGKIFTGQVVVSLPDRQCAAFGRAVADRRVILKAGNGREIALRKL